MTDRERGDAWFAFWLLTTFILGVALFFTWYIRYEIGYSEAKIAWRNICIENGYLEFGVDSKTGLTHNMWWDKEANSFVKEEND